MVANRSDDTQREEEVFTRKYLYTNLSDGLTCYLRLSSVFKRLITSLMQSTDYGEIPTSIHLELSSQQRYTRLQSTADTSDSLKYCGY